MKASELIKELEKQISENGDQQIFTDVTCTSCDADVVLEDDLNLSLVNNWFTIVSKIDDEDNCIGFVIKPSWRN